MEDNYTLITFKYRSGWFRRTRTVSFPGSVSKFIAIMQTGSGKVPVILFSTPITEKEFQVARRAVLKSKGLM